LFDGLAAAGGNLFGAHELLEGVHGRVDHVDGVVGAQGLRQHVLHAGALEHRADRATGDDAGTRGGRAEHDDAGGGLALHRVGDGAGDHRDAEEVLASFLGALLDGRGNFLGLAVADAHVAFAVADDHEGGEAEATTTLHDLRHAVDGDDALQVLVALVLLAAVVTATAAAVATIVAAVLV